MTKRVVLKLNDTEIRQWLKNNIRFDAKADGNGLYLRYRETDKKPVFSFDLNSLVLSLRLFWVSTPTWGFRWLGKNA